MSSKIIYHNHHIIPKHMGGTDDPSNLVKLTIEEHAEAHKQLYLKYGLIEDKLAWLGLRGLYDRDYIITEAHRQGCKKGRKIADAIIFEKYGVTNANYIPGVKELLREKNKLWCKMNPPTQPHNWLGRTHSEDTKRKIGEANSKHQKGKNNSQYGKMWITDGNDNRTIKKTEDIPENWYKGRTIKK